MPEELKKGAVKPNAQASPGPIGNTQGIIVPKTATNPDGNSAPPPQPKEEGWWKRWGSDWTHNALDVVGLIPVAGELSDGANALIYAAEGDKINAAISLTAMAPLAGDAVTAGKWALKGVKKIEKEAMKEAEEAAAKKLAKEAEEAAAKKAAKEAEEKAAKEAEEKAAKGGYTKGECKQLEKGPPGAKYKGGKHGKVQEDSQRFNRESHHIPPDSISPYGKTNGPAISMDYNDHRKLSSTSRMKSHPVSIAQQKLANSGSVGFLAAMMVEITEIRSIADPSDKYDAAIFWMLLWAACMGYIPNPTGSKAKK